MTFKGWQKTSLIEYPGKIATVVFTGGCNFRCPFCYNADLVERPQELADLPAETVIQYLRENRSLYQALVVSGGEPTMNTQIPEFLVEVKKLGLSVGLETNGTNSNMIARLLEKGLLDYIAVDVKAPLDWEAYSRAAGLKEENEGLLEEVLRTLRLLRNCGEVEVELRCTVVPQIHTSDDILRLAGQLPGHQRFVLQQFIPEKALDEQLRREAPFSADVLRKIHLEIGESFSRCELRGI